MNMNNPLIPGTIQKIFEKGSGAAVESPYLQIIHLKSFEKDTNGPPRYKIVLSDSKHYMQGTLATSLNNLVDDKTIELNSVVKLVKYAVNSIKNHRLVFVAEIAVDDVMKTDLRIGEPGNIDPSASKATDNTNITNNGPVSNTTSSSSYESTVNTSYTPSTSNAPLSANNKNSSTNNNNTNYNNNNNNNNNNNKASNSGFKASNTSSATGGTTLQPISSLSPYKDRNEIQARVTSKTDVKKWTNERGEGRLFSVNLLDSSGEIRLTCFNDSVDQYFDLLQIGKIYNFANFQVKIAKRQFGNIQCDYEIAVDSNTQITSVLDDVSGIPTISYSFVPISKISESNKDALLDVIGIVKECGELGEITVKTTQKQLTKRELTLIDTSLGSIKLTLWGKQAEEFSNTDNPVFAIKAARVNEYQGRTLSSTGSSVISLNPDIPEAHTLRGWFDSQNGQITNLTNVSSSANNPSSASKNSGDDQRKFLSQIKDESLGQHDKPDYFSTIASVTFIKSEGGSISYMACPTEGCNKKVVEEGPHQYRCERCQKVFDRCDHRYIMTVQISDSTGVSWVQAFNETGAQILGKSADEMYYLKMNDDQSYQQIIKDCTFKTFLFRIRAKLDTYQGESRTRCNLMSAQAIDFEKDAQSMITRLESYYS